MNSSQLPRLLLGLAVGAGFLVLAFQGVSFDELGDALSRVDVGWLAAAVVVSFLIMAFRAWRWQLELKPLEHVPLGRLWVVTSVAYMAINLFPFRLGEVVRPWLLSRRSGVSFPNVVGNLVVEKTMDSVCILLYMLGGLLTISTLPEWVRRFALFPAGVAITLVVLVLLMYSRGEDFFETYVIRWFPERFRDAVSRIVKAVVEGMQILPNPSLLLSVFVVSVALWALPILSSWVMIQAFGFDVPASAAVVVFIFIGIGTALPNAPGMIGAFQYACQLALGLFGVEKVDALAFGLVLNAVQFLTLILQGLIALPIAGVTFSELRAASNDQTPEEQG